MKKQFIFLIVCVVAVVGVIIYTGQGLKDEDNQQVVKDTTKTNETSSTDSTDTNSEQSEIEIDNGGDSTEGETVEDVKPASDVYKSADEALVAIRNGAKNYDDLVLEQFVEPSDKCTWCGELYKTLDGLLLDPGITDEERAYFSEIMAISGRMDNIKALSSKVEAATNSEQAETFSEALELTYGDSSVVDYLGTLMSSDNKLLRDSSIAAVTNHGSKQAAEMLYAQAVKDNNPDGFYSNGSGLGELTPDAEAIPFLKEKAELNNEYSHLAIKSLLNYGTEGVKDVLQILNKPGTSPEVDKKMLENALDHLAIDEATEQLLKEAQATATSERAKQFIQQALAELPPQAEPDQDSSEVAAEDSAAE